MYKKVNNMFWVEDQKMQNGWTKTMIVRAPNIIIFSTLKGKVCLWGKTFFQFK